MRRTRFKGDVMSSLFKRPSDIRRARRLAITSLVTLGTAVLFGLASQGPAVIESVPHVGQETEEKSAKS